MAKAKKQPTRAAKKPTKAAKSMKAKRGASKAKPAKATKAGKTAKKPAKAAKKPAKAAKPIKAAKKPAKAARPRPAATAPARAASPPASATPAAAELAKLAVSGDLGVLQRLVDSSPDRDLLAYKWLAVASDHGHADADEVLAELRESGSLDDEQTGHVHFELGLAYLTGSDGLGVDHDKARSQLANAKEREYPASATTLQHARDRLDDDARTVFDAVYDVGSPGSPGDSTWGNEHTHNDPDPADDAGHAGGAADDRDET